MKFYLAGGKIGRNRIDTNGLRLSQNSRLRDLALSERTDLVMHHLQKARTVPALTLELQDRLRFLR